MTDDLGKDAAGHTLALNPLVALQPNDLLGAAGAAAKALATQPQALGTYVSTLAAEWAKVLTGASDVAPLPGDKRFFDKAWTSSRAHRSLMQAYLAWGRAVEEVVADLELSDENAARARLLSSILVDTLAPTNNPVLNPSAVKELIDTGGKSAVNGFIHFLEDMATNGGLPSSVDSSKFEIGKNVATTPGAVVFRNEVLELVRYTPTTEAVGLRPLVVVPPQINKYYSMDLSPEKSMVKFLLDAGVQLFCVSWRNPTPKQADWGLDTYVTALDEGVDVALDITGADKVNVIGSCSGGITLSTYLAYLAGKEQEKVSSVTLAVCVLDADSESESDFAALVTPATLKAAKQASKLRGVLDGGELAKMFAWMRPNDLIWNYWVNNYLMGRKPPAFDVLFWNADTTRLPARLHADYLDIGLTNPFVNAGAMTIDGVPIDLSKVDLETFIVAGTTDHITPWKAVYRTAQLYGSDTTFVLSNSGHLQSILNPPGNPKSWYRTAPASADTADGWAVTAEKRKGSWWPAWVDFLRARSGDEVPAPKEPQTAKYPALAPAPGTYVFEK